MEVSKMVLRYNGLFDFDGLYAAIIDWAKNYGYFWNETVYKHKVPSPAGAEQEFLWVLKKNVTDYIGYEISMIVHMYDFTEVHVDMGNRKKTLANARLYIIFTGNLKLDWQKKLSGSRFFSKLGEWYKGIIMKKELGSVHADNLHYRILNLHSLVKQYFDMQTKKYEYKGYLKEN